MTRALGLRIRMYSRHFSRSKSKYGWTSILLMTTTSQMENISGYFSGLSSPSGTDKIIALHTAPVSNSAGQTRFPTFSRMTRSAPPRSTLSSPWRVISASRWHIPPVCSWMEGIPVAAWIFTASTSLSMSASITATRILSFSRLMVRISVVVLPLPGEDIRLSRKTPRRLSSLRSSSASLSLSAKTLFLISITLTGSILKVTGYDPGRLLICGTKSLTRYAFRRTPPNFRTGDLLFSAIAIIFV